ncbi:hypothetical protein Goari_019033, partial [Gossypium aridum]|nr:hypothetical protein [Gossypium aridum]
EFRSCNFSSHSLSVQLGQGILDKLVTVYLPTERLRSKATAGTMSNRVAQTHSMISTNNFSTKQNIKRNCKANCTSGTMQQLAKNTKCLTKNHCHKEKQCAEMVNDKIGVEKAEPYLNIVIVEDIRVYEEEKRGIKLKGQSHIKHQRIFFRVPLLACLIAKIFNPQNL